jgi:hypothetical protein
MGRTLVLFLMISLLALMLGCQRDSNPLGTAVPDGSMLAGQKAGKAALWRVPGDFSTLQDAIDDDAVQDGDLIMVGPGEFAGAIVSKGVRIKGVGIAVINDGPLPWPGVRPFKAGFLFPGSGSGNGARISHLKIEAVEFPVFSRGADNVTIEQCTMLNAIQAVSNWRGSGWAIIQNEIIDLRSSNGGGIGVLIGDYLGGVVTDNVVSHNKLSGTLHVASNDGGGYNGSGIVLYADFRWGMPGATAINLNRVTKNKVSLISDTPEIVDIAAIELTEATVAPLENPVIYDNAIGFNDLRGTALQIVLSPTTLDNPVNDISRNFGDNRGKGLHPSVFSPGLGKVKSAD